MDIPLVNYVWWNIYTSDSLCRDIAKILLYDSSWFANSERNWYDDIDIHKRKVIYVQSPSVKVDKSYSNTTGREYRRE